MRLRRRIRRAEAWLDDHGWSLAFALAAGAILAGLALLISTL